MYRIQATKYSPYQQSSCMRFNLNEYYKNPRGQKVFFQDFETLQDAERYLIELSRNWHKKGIINDDEHRLNLIDISDGFLKYDSAFCTIREI